MTFDDWAVLHRQKLLEQYLQELKQAVGDRFGDVIRELHAGINGHTFEETERLFLLSLVAKVTGEEPETALARLWTAGWPKPSPAPMPSAPPWVAPVATAPPVPSAPPPGAVGPRSCWSPEQWAKDAGIRQAAIPVTSLPPVATSAQEPDGLPPLPEPVEGAYATPPLFTDDKARKHFIRVLGILRSELHLMRQACPDHNWLDLQRCGILSPEIVNILRLTARVNKDIDWRTKRERLAMEHPGRVRGTVRNTGGAGQ